MKKLLLLFFVLLCVFQVNAQVSNPFSFTVTPSQGTAVLDKYVGGYQQISWPVIVALPPGTAGNFRAYRVISPFNPTNGSNANWSGDTEVPSCVRTDH